MAMTWTQAEKAIERLTKDGWLSVSKSNLSGSRQSAYSVTAYGRKGNPGHAVFYSIEQVESGQPEIWTSYAD